MNPHFDLGAIQVVVNQYLPPGNVYMIAQPPEPVRLPFVLGCDFGTKDQTAITVFRYLPLVMPDPRKIIALTNLLGETDAIDKRWKRRERKMVSLKRKAREQRRLDWQSNVRRRKRRVELERRKANKQAAGQPPREGR